MKKSIHLLIILILISFQIQAQNIPSYIPSNGLVGWWPFNGNANDESGNGNNGTVNGALLTTDRHGQPNNAYYFSPSNNSFIITNTIATAIITNFTTSVWVNSLTSNTLPPQGATYNGNGAFGTQCVIHPPHGACYGSSSSNVGTGFHVGNNGVVVLEHTAGYVRASIVSQLNLSGWHYITVVYNNNTPTLYVDGSFIASGTSGPMTAHPSMGFDNSGYYPTSGIGAGGGGNFLGSIDDIAIWNRALTQQEISALYQAQACTLNISSEPANCNTTVGNNSSFTVGTNSNCNTPIIYQWQTNLGFGWQSLQNAGQYSGVNTASLQVMNVNHANTNQLFRCIASNGNMTDTSQTATLTLVGSNSNLSGITHAIPYQAVVRDINGNVLGNHPIKVRCTLHDSSASGNSIYRETHSLNTNNLGLFTLHIGNGTASIGNMDSVNWALNKKYIQIEVDTTSSGLSFIDLGTQQLMAVPYALYAETSGTALSGPKGDKGDTGAQGVAGATGPQGLQGATGPQGPAGQGGFTHYIGEVFGGGVIFHLWKDSVGTEHGLIVDKMDLAIISEWSNLTNTPIGISAQSSWNGLSNSNAIITQPGHTNSAAALCLNSTNGGQNDWYLPSIQELNILWSNYIDVARTLTQMSGATPLTLSQYCSSTEYNNYVWYFSFANGGVEFGGKSLAAVTRAVRAF